MKKHKTKSRRTKIDRVKIFFLSALLKAMFKLESYLLFFKSVNYPKTKPCIFALWHAHQCAIYGNKDREHLYALISPSNDGEIIAAATECVGIKTIRGSKGRRGVASSMELLEKLEQGNSIAITVDGPRGPLRVVKDGVINIAKLSQVPIIPVMWHSEDSTFLKFNTWDKFRFPFLLCNTVASYGDPIYVPADISKEEAEKYRLQLEEKMKELYIDLKSNYKQYSKQKDL